jgi:hypothetical protein
MQRFILILLAFGVVCSVQGKTYQHRDPVTCLDESFTCPTGQYPFFDQQGCGCYTPKPCAENGDNTLNAAAVTTPGTALVAMPKAADRYISRDTELCQYLRFSCATDFYPFFNQQGCGCASKQLVSQCQPQPAVNLYTTLTAKPYYLSTDSEACQQLRFRCKERNSYPFFDQTGCGCRTQVCADTAQYFISREARQCQQIRFTCRQGFTAFFSELGCGCVPVTKATVLNES